MNFGNYIPDANPFKLSGPPAYFLQRLHDFDDSLVIVPSKQGFYYRLGQKRKLNLKENIVNNSLFNESDTKLLASHSLVPVTTIMATCRWDNPLLFKELEERAPWRLGGTDKVEKHILDYEAQKEAKKIEARSQYLTDVAKDGWRLYQAKTGQRTFIDKARERPSSASSTYKVNDSRIIIPS